MLLPPLATRGEAHVGLLSLFHRLVELRESGQIMMEVSSHTRARTFPDLKNILATWRERTPNKWDPLNVFDDLFTWRGHVFAAVTSNFAWSDASSLAALHDKPWTVIKMATVARQQNVKDVSLTSLSKLYATNVMDVPDAFQKLREQIMACEEGPAGLNIINNTNLDFFSAQQKAELFRLKAEFLGKNGQRTKANQAYCHSSQIAPSYGKTWSSWGSSCEAMAVSTEMSLAKDVNASASAKSDGATKIVQLTSQAVACNLEAIRCGRSNARALIPGVLWALRRDGSTAGLLCGTLEAQAKELDPWVWIPYIPLLLSSLSRIEGKVMKEILSSVGKAFPEALFYPLRAFMIERKESEARAGAGAGGGGSAGVAQELMNGICKDHPSLFAGLEIMLGEFDRFALSWEQQLLTDLTVLVERIEALGEGGGGLPEEMLERVRGTLVSISTTYFADEPGREEFVSVYKEPFAKHFLAPTLPPMNTVLSRLMLWQRRLRNSVKACEGKHALAATSAVLAAVSCESPDLFSNSGGGSKGASGTAAAAAAAAAASAAIVAASGGGGMEGAGVASIEIPGGCVASEASFPLPPPPSILTLLRQVRLGLEAFAGAAREDREVRERGGSAAAGRRLCSEDLHARVRRQGPPVSARAPRRPRNLHRHPRRHGGFLLGPAASPLDHGDAQTRRHLAGNGGAPESSPPAGVGLGEDAGAAGHR
jgi:transformation/transcription domain-associated protein